jgi:N-acetylglucosamine kinase-like BadF-type ATPase
VSGNTSNWPGAWLLVEGGGSRTWVAVLGDRPAQLVGPSTNMFTAPRSSARKDLRALLGAVLALAGISAVDVSLVFAAHGAAATNRSAELFAGFLTEILSDLNIRAQLIVTSDMVPVIASTQGDAVVAAIVGTGTVYVAHRELKHWARASGADYLLSDEGGGFDLGMGGLRAAIKATDGRGPPTELVASARQWVAASSEATLRDALFERVYVAHPRSVVAEFARLVLETAGQGDNVALQLIETAADEVLIGVLSVAERVRIAQHSPRVVVSGSLATVESPLRHAILSRLRHHLSPAAISNYEPGDLAAGAAGIVRLIEDQDEQIQGLRTVVPVSVRVVK